MAATGRPHGSLEFTPKTTTHRAETGRNCIGMSHFITFSRRVKSDTMPRIVGIPQAVERGNKHERAVVFR